jgi:hypothetical protein
MRRPPSAPLPDANIPDRLCLGHLKIIDDFFPHRLNAHFWDKKQENISNSVLILRFLDLQFFSTNWQKSPKNSDHNIGYFFLHMYISLANPAIVSYNACAVNIYNT